MKQWPPRLPRNDLYMEAFEMLIENVQSLLTHVHPDPFERELVKALKPRNTTIGFAVERSEKTREETFVVLLETSKRFRYEHFRIFALTTNTQYFSIDTNVTHTAINTLKQKRHAQVLANLLAHDFYEARQEEHDFAAMAGATKRELNKISPARLDPQLRKIYQQIRNRALPLV